MAVPITAREPVEAWPPAAPGVMILVRVPTPYERDGFAATLARNGIVYYSREQLRDLMLAGADHLFPDRAEDVQIQLQELWKASDAFEVAQAKRLDAEIELRERDAAKVKKRGRPLTKKEQEALDAEVKEAIEAIQADVVLPDRVRIQRTALQQQIQTRYEPLQTALGDLAESEHKRDWLMIRNYVVGWSGIEHQPEGGGKGLLEHEVAYLRGQLGKDAFEEVGSFITALHGLDKDEEKNLASLLESMSAQTGSTPSTEGTSSDDGTSTDASSGSTQEPSESLPTTA